MTFRELIEETKKVFLWVWDESSSAILDTEISTFFYALVWIVGVILGLWVSLFILGVLGSLTGEFLKRYYPPLYDFFKYYDPPDNHVGLVILLVVQGVVVYAFYNSGITGAIVVALICLVIDFFIIRAMYRRYKRLKSGQLVSLD